MQVRFTTTLAALAVAAASGSTLVAALNPLGSAPANPDPLSVFGPLVSGLSTSCQTAFAGFVTSPTDPLTDCLNLVQGLDLLGKLQTNVSLAPTVDQYLGGLCQKQVCSPSTLLQANQTINSQCSAQDKAVNNGLNGAAFFQSLISNYFIYRNVGCLAGNTTNQNCVVDTMFQIQNTTNLTMTLPITLELISGGNATAKLLQTYLVNKPALCTDCNKAMASALWQAQGITGQQALANLGLNSTVTPNLTSIQNELNRTAEQNNKTTVTTPQQQQDRQKQLVKILTEVTQYQCGNTFFDGMYPFGIKNSTRPAGSSSSSTLGASAASANSAFSMLASREQGLVASFAAFVAAAGLAVVAL